MPTLVRTSFYEGFKSSLDPTIISETSMWKGYNVRSDISGILRLREGIESVFPSLGGNKIQGAIEAFGIIVFVFDTNVYTFDEENEIVTRLSTISVTPDIDDQVTLLRWSRSGSEIVYIFGGNKIYETNGKTVTSVTPYTPTSGEDPNMLGNEVGPAKAKLATLRASLSQRVAVAGIPGSPNTVYLSSPLDITYFPVSQILQLPDDGGYITGITNWYNALIVFRNKDIWAFFGTDLTDSSASLVLQDGSVGCIAPKTITHVPDLGIVFVGPDNIYALSGVTGVENQAKAKPIADDVVNFVQRAIDEGGLEDAAGVYFNREVRISFSRSTHDQRVFRLNLQTNDPAWYMDTGPLSNNYVIKDGELYGSYPTQGSFHRITKDTLFEESTYRKSSYFGNLFNDNMFNESDDRSEYKELTGIPFSITFRRENLQPGPARIKRIFLYVVAIGSKTKEMITNYGNVFNDFMFNERTAEQVTIDTSNEQNFDLTIYVDGNEIQIDDLKIHSGKLKNQIISHSEPVRVYEARIRPSLKGHFAQLKVESRNAGELIGLLGYGIDYEPKGRIRGIRQGVTNNKDW